MPVILDAVDYDTWLNPESGDVAYMLAPSEADRRTARAVSAYANNARNQGSECVAASQD